MLTDLTVAGAAVALASALILGIYRVVKALMGLGVWLAAINRNTTATVDLTTEISRMRVQMDANTRRIERLEREQDRPHRISPG